MPELSVRDIFADALELPAGERAAFLDRVCGGDVQRRQRVERLLAAHRTAGAFLAEPSISPEPPGLERPGSRVGPYTVIEPIGEGGFGRVYLAEQESPIRRKVALKIIKLGMDTRQVIARFEAERQALAMMDHPSIARVLDAGATESGRPYFVMELVAGEPLTSYCDDAKLGVRERLALFQQVCHGVQHAHQKGIIHRDLKPGNVLVVRVDQTPVPKIIDFGIAKATAGVDLRTGVTLMTEGYQLLGTPQYMSPEQAEGSADIDTRTDVYSLGVMLYELLTGTTPFDAQRLRGAPLSEIQRIIREEDPPRPSTRLARSGSAEAPAQAEADRSRLAAALRSDLDWIVMKCLDKERARRYSTANDLALDISRFLAGEPVSAAPPSTMYRARKFLRRHRPQVAAAALIALSLLMAAVGTGVFAIREARQRAQAQQRAEEIRRIADFQAGLLARVHVPRMGRDFRAGVLQKATRHWRDQNASDEELAARTEQLQSLLEGVSFTTLTLDALDRHLFIPTLEAIDHTFQAEDHLRARLLQRTAQTLTSLGLYQQALDPLREALRLYEPLGPDHPDLLSAHHDMGELLSLRMESQAARPHALKALEGQMRVLGPEHEQTLASAQRLAVILMRLDRPERAEQLLRDVLRIRERHRPVDDEAAIETAWYLTMTVFSRSHDEAEVLAREGLARAIRTLGDLHRATLRAEMTVAYVRLQRGWRLEAEARMRRLLPRFGQEFGDDHRETLRLRLLLLTNLIGQGRLEEAEREAEILAGDMRVLGENHFDHLFVQYETAVLRREQGRLAEAESGFGDLLHRVPQFHGPAYFLTHRAAHDLAALLAQSGREAEAAAIRERFIREALVEFQSWNEEGAFFGFTPPFHQLLCSVKDDGALQREFVEAVRARYGAADRRTFQTLQMLAERLALADRLPEAETLARGLVDQATAHGPPTALPEALETLGMIVADRGRAQDAVEIFEQAEQLRRGGSAAHDGRPSYASIRWAKGLLQLGRYAEAESVLLQARTRLGAGPEPDRRGPVALVRTLAELYEAWHTAEPLAGRDAQAAAWRTLLQTPWSPEGDTQGAGAAADGPNLQRVQGSPGSSAATR